MAKIRISAFLSLLFLLTVLPLGAVMLGFETVGTLTDIDLAIGESSTPNSFITGEYWTRSGFAGRLIYQGPAGNTLAVDIGDPLAVPSATDRFYFTRSISSTSSDTNDWRQYFIVTRTKGLYHDGSQHDFSGINVIVENPGDTIPITRGAGFETVSIGETGYNTTGGSGIYNGSNGYQYLYPYQYLWIDIIVIRTFNSSGLTNSGRGNYQSILTFNGPGMNANLVLRGYYRSRNYDPDSYYFGVERVVSEYIPYSELITKTSLENSLLVGYLRYHSTDWAGTVRFASNAEGTETNFQFTATVNQIVRSFPYYVVFDSSIPAGNATRIYTTSNTFSSTWSSIQNLIGGDPFQNEVLQGEIRIFVPSNMTMSSIPSSTYSSIIYCILTTN
ncbi:MAG: hypothetical protein CVV52_11020 [Spirochaetae bacterium HGW-Spirochaetae-8]|jgi:hypothetical protein|nr:MAG: hypothetical protein CVV52_11020 [Spirochaetae bacterium HGW-Spirochaetae-8]